MHEPIQLIYGLHNMYLYIRPEQGHHSKTTNTLFRYSYSYDNESTAGADASVEMPKLHNIKLLLIAFMHMIKTI